MKKENKTLVEHIDLLDLRVVPKHYQVLLNAKDIKLPKLTFELLMYFINSQNQLSSLDDIAKGVWGDVVVSNETVVQRVTLLRKAIKDDPKLPRYIESVRGRGYRLMPTPVVSTNLESDEKESSIEPKALADVSQSGKGISKRSRLMIASVALVCFIVLIWMTTKFYLNDNSGLKPESKSDNASTVKLIERAEHYLALGQYSNVKLAIELFEQAKIASEDSFEAHIGHSFALSKSVCRYNQAQMAAQDAKIIAQTALDLAKTSEQKSEAYKTIAYAWDCMGNLELALKLYLSSLEFDKKNVGSISSAAYLYEVKGELLSAYELNQQALQINPDNHMAKLQQTRIYELLNYTKQASQRYKQLFILYPDNVFVNEAYPRFLFYHGNFSLAQSELNKVIKRGIQRSGIFSIKAELALLLEGKEAAIVWYKKADAISSGQSFASDMLKILQLEMGSVEVKEHIANIETRASEGNTWPNNYLEAAVMSLWVLKDRELAIQLLQKSVEAGFLDSHYLTISPLFSELKDSPAFFELIDLINQKRTDMSEDFVKVYSPPSINI